MKRYSTKQKRAPAGGQKAGEAKSKRSPRLSARNGVVLILAAGVLLLFGIWEWKRRQSSDLSALPAPGVTNAASAPEVGAAVRPEFQKLQGKWLRPDGGYILEIKSVDINGMMVAAYFNPQPIHVAKAVALQDGGTTKIFVELRDVNYPGSTYTLAYDPQRDQLQGLYYQAVEQQNFEVAFERIK
jgi:hypothetical protein